MTNQMCREHVSVSIEPLSFEEFCILDELEVACKRVRLGEGLVIYYSGKAVLRTDDGSCFAINPVLN